MRQTFPLLFLYSVLFSSPLSYASDKATETNTPAPATKNQAVLEGYSAQKVAEHTYVIHGPLEVPNPDNKGFMNNPAFIISDKSVAVVDPGSSVHVGQAVLTHIKKLTDKPITMVFNTHVHGDHWLGNQAFIENNPKVKIYAHPEMIKAAQAGDAEAWIKNLSEMTKGATDGTKAVIPTEALQDGQVIKIDNLSIKAHLNEHAHTKTDAMYEVVEDKLLFTGDNVTYQRIPRMRDGSFRGSVAVIEKALAQDFKYIVPGHGATGGQEVLTAYKVYLSTIYESAKALAEEGLEAFEMKQKIKEKLGDYKDWAGFEDELGKHISLAVLEAEQAEFE
jgi:glyoxylase-like metal-dependent hydrolase (beta-lactamase superfamily II)